MKVLSDFKKTKACINNNNFELKTKKNRFFDEAIIVKDFCKDRITGEWTPTTLQELKDEIAVSYTDENIDTIEETQEAHVTKLAKCIWRYGKSEYRSNGMVPDDAIVLDLSNFVHTHFVDDDDIHVKFDVIVREPGKLEGIIYKPKAPKIGTTGRSYQNVDNTIELHLMRLALRKYADTFLTTGEQIEIYASYYYMSKTGDKTDAPFELEDYFDSKTLIRSQVETYTKDMIVLPSGENLPDEYEEIENADGEIEKKELPLTLDQKLQILLDKYAAGFEKCDLNEEKDCRGCANYCVCYYQPAPVRFEEEKQIKVRKSHQLTDEQQTIVDFRHGVAICNAVPGSGKTETAIKQRTVSIVSDEADAIIAAVEAGTLNYDFSEPLAPKFLTMDSRR